MKGSKMTTELDIVKELTETTERSKSNSHRLDKNEIEIKEFKEDTKKEIKEIKQDQKAIYELAYSVKAIASDLGTIKTDISEVKQGQNNLTNCQIELSNKVDKEINSVKSEINNVKTQDDVNFAKSIKKGVGKIIVEIFKYLAIGGLGYLLATITK